ncbi:hypothetical protein [Candidatus Methylacidithermus pantelleriae]|uniref:Outer membrane lipoprotein-sorting protein n=1 Tax=Candidatus Methylacidithermus pantelleriae TaxID=2744239 RepID=A0A8J2BSF8_9BACT|nr:hypothetical protein [Candidatus Methylacidithermus pantelleriae]CAF0696340.1 conserved exported hypothetical protein [Candidatus Methylacidithermus pantelleriae]
MRVSVCVLLVLGVVALQSGRATSALPSPSPELPPVDEVLSRVIQRDEETSKALGEYRYSETVRLEKLDDEGKVVGSTELEVLCDPKEGIVLLSEPKEQGEDPPDTDESKRKATKESEKIKAAISLRELIPHFRIQLLGTDEWKGQPAYALGFEPKRNEPHQNWLQKVLYNLRGVSLVSMRDYSVLDTRASLTQPVELAWILAQMKQLDCHYEAQPIGPWYGPARLEIEYRLSYVVGGSRRRQILTMHDFVPRQQAQAVPSALPPGVSPPPAPPPLAPVPESVSR